ncbi:MAG TPA: endonuclease/exonuclease/phosphatase family protein [Novosphingobium sp.]|nr:endonuclease/exonuclease/phosphatase family protein [Novosphingobium sp.]
MPGRNPVGSKRFATAARVALSVSLPLLAAARLGAPYPALDLINLAAAPLALASVLAAALLLLRTRTWPGRIVFFICCIPGSLLLLPQATARGDCRPGAERLRVAWINAHNPEQPDRIARWLETEQPQIVGIAELASGLPLRRVLEERWPYWQSCLGNGRCSTLLYSRVPPAEAQGLAHGDPENRQALSAAHMGFAAKGADSVPHSRPAQIYAVHLSRPLPLGWQARELLALDEHLRSGPDTIVMGDMNMSPRMQLLRDFAARNGLSVTPVGSPTWPVSIGGHSFSGLWQIDHLLVGRNWQVVAIRPGPDVGSDHKGFVADLCRRHS